MKIRQARSKVKLYDDETMAILKTIAKPYDYRAAKREIKDEVKLEIQYSAELSNTNIPDESEIMS